ncbi:hypothetical protein AMJ57_04940 [Parcubacteria bacterium SG8_24]|nr:MAG: hypothetical protein AMJ57_04940 [Parcubacteria bacterium SG8_24]
MQLIALYLVKYSFVLFIVAFGTYLYGRHLIGQGQHRKARVPIWVSLISSSLVCASYVLAVVMLPGNKTFDILLAAVWGYFTYVDIKLLKSIGGL